MIYFILKQNSFIFIFPGICSFLGCKNVKFIHHICLSSERQPLTSSWHVVPLCVSARISYIFAFYIYHPFCIFYILWVRILLYVHCLCETQICKCKIKLDKRYEKILLSHTIQFGFK